MKITHIKFFTFFFSFSFIAFGKIDSKGEKLHLLTTPSYNKGLDGWRLGVGVGYALYIGNQMDYTITTNYGEFNELRPNFTLGAFKTQNLSNEFGAVYKHGSFQTLKSLNTQGLQCDYDELQFMFQHSLNENVNLNAGSFTCNVQLGAGLTYFKSRYFLVNTQTKALDVTLSSIGYGYNNRIDKIFGALQDVPGKKIALLGNLGINLGFRISSKISLYLENSLQVTLSNKLSGNLYKKSLIPPDSYYYMGLSIYYRFGRSANRLRCPKF